MIKIITLIQNKISVPVTRYGAIACTLSRNNKGIFWRHSLCLDGLSYFDDISENAEIWADDFSRESQLPILDCRYRDVKRVVQNEGPITKIVYKIPFYESDLKVRYAN